jgi:site-specific recombinase XerD
MLTMTTTHSVELFLTTLRGQNYSPKTLRAYGDDLRQFIERVRENRVDWDTPQRFGRADIEGLMRQKQGKRSQG